MKSVVIAGYVRSPFTSANKGHLAKVRQAIHTAAGAIQTDGAAAVLVCSEDYAKRKDIEILARIRSIAVAGCAPEMMRIGGGQGIATVLEAA